MASTAFSTKIRLTSDILGALRPKRQRLFLIFKDPKLRPPVLEEMMPDLQRVIATVANQYRDETTPHLQFDELMGEGNLVLSKLISKGIMGGDKCPTRHSFFAFFKTSVNNNTKSRVQKYRFTEKRTGQKPPPRQQQKLDAPKAAHDSEETPEYHKNVDLSLDDPDLGLQVPDMHDVDSGCDENDIDWGFSQTAAEFAFQLTPVEKLVFHELISPSAHARCYAELDAMRKGNKGKVTVKIKFTHMAEAVGISTELFSEAVLSIRNKTLAHRMVTQEQHDGEARQNAIIAQLKLVFGLQIPTDLDGMVVRRMLTMAARDQFDKVSPQVAEMLTEVNAKVPRSIGNGKLACYGILYSKNARQCNTCDLRHSCSVEAANLGLSKMAISPKLLGARQQRTPAYLPRPTNEPSQRITSNDEAEIISHLDETFNRAERQGRQFWYHYVGAERKRCFLFCLDSEAPMKLRFCEPSDELKKKLTGKQKTWYPRDNTPLAELIALIEQHSKETFE
jgi:hypothetical protein